MCSRGAELFLTPVWLGSPPQVWSTYQSPSHSQLREGSWKLWSGWGFIPVTSLHGQRSVGSSVSVKPSTGFHLWKNKHKKNNTNLALIIISIYSVKIYNLVPPGFHRSPPGSGSGSHWASYWGKHGGHSRCPSSAPSLQRHVWALAASHQHVPSAGRL